MWASSLGRGTITANYTKRNEKKCRRKTATTINELMPSTSIACGTLLVLIGILGYVNGVMTNHASPTALIPAAFGILLIILGVIARMKESLRKHLMHLAVIIALLGFVLTAGRLISKMSELTYSAAVVSQVSMALVCLLFVVLAVKSFTDARRRSEPA
jgi:ABC-type transport system involved in cytochrome c biogenesis permease subunit